MRIKLRVYIRVSIFACFGYLQWFRVYLQFGCDITSLESNSLCDIIACIRYAWFGCAYCLEAVLIWYLVVCSSVWDFMIT